MEIEKQLTLSQYVNREYSAVHAPIEKELAFYDYVKSGDEENVRRTMTPLGSGDVGKLSDDPLRNLRYHLIITIALITRFCVDGGMEPEKAYTLSDIYINRADKAADADALHRIHGEAIMSFTRKMRSVRKEKICSKPVIMCMDYIYDHLHEKITLDDLAAATGLTASYISRIFHKETSLTVTDYILSKRVETAQNMLRYSDMPPVEIANLLAFSSHSHFISIFRKYTGMTPNRYREENYRANDLTDL